MRGFPECRLLPCRPSSSSSCVGAGGSLRVSAEGFGRVGGSAVLRKVGAVSSCLIGEPGQPGAKAPAACCLGGAGGALGYMLRRLTRWPQGMGVCSPTLQARALWESCPPRRPGIRAVVPAFLLPWARRPAPPLAGKPACLAWHPAGLGTQRPHCAHPTEPLGR